MENKKKLFTADPIQLSWVVKLDDFMELNEEIFWKFYNSAFRFLIQKELRLLTPTENGQQLLNQSVYDELSQIANSFIEQIIHPCDQMHDALYGEKRNSFANQFDKLNAALEPEFVEQLNTLLDQSTEKVKELQSNYHKFYMTFNRLRNVFTDRFMEIKTVKASKEYVDDINERMTEKVIPEMKTQYKELQEVVELLMNEVNGIIDTQMKFFDEFKLLITESMNKKPEQWD